MYRLLLIAFLPQISAYVDCKVACYRCRENKEHPMVLEVHCAMCEECKQRRREQMQAWKRGETTGPLETSWKQASRSRAVRVGDEDGVELMPDKAIGLGEFHYVGESEECPTPPPCESSEEEVQILKATVTTTIRTTTTQTTTTTKKPCPPIVTCRRKKRKKIYSQPCSNPCPTCVMPCMPMCGNVCPPNQLQPMQPMYPPMQQPMQPMQHGIQALTIAPRTEAAPHAQKSTDYYYVYVGVPKPLMNT